MVLVLKTNVARVTVGSNPTPSGIFYYKIFIFKRQPRYPPAKPNCPAAPRRATLPLLYTEGMGFEPMGARSSAELAIRFFRPLRHPSSSKSAIRSVGRLCKASRGEAPPRRPYRGWQGRAKPPPTSGYRLCRDYAGAGYAEAKPALRSA